jgi:hypothetical protein
MPQTKLDGIFDLGLIVEKSNKWKNIESKL